VDEVNGVVEIRSRDGWTPKTAQSERHIPLNPELVELLRSLRKDGPYVFPGTTPDEPIGSFKKTLRTAVAKARIYRNGKPVHLSAQSYRKAHATWQAMRGVNEGVLQGLLGHAAGSRVTQKYYVHATEEAKRAAVIRLPFAEHSGNGSGPKLATSGN
jgi:integrase